ncbi:MAG: ABC transporter permease subunit [Rhodobacteraceae bacterium]|nr:ABC transporter permease subunit [Paracoccaceae bacterium]
MASSIPPQNSYAGLSKGVVSLLVFLALWAGAALYVQDGTLLPSPDIVARIFWEEALSGEMAFHMVATLARVIAAFILAMSIGSLLGIATGRNPSFNSWASPWLIIFLNLPALVVIVLCYLWIGLTEVAAVTAVALNKIPMIAVMMREGARALDPALDDMAQTFEMRPLSRWRHVIMPQLAPHFASAGRAGFALIWKIVLVVEFLGRSNGIGFQIHLNFQLFEVGHILAYAFGFIAIMLVIEYLVVQPWEKSSSAWRRKGVSG